jgi:hypothetical protein
VSSVACPTLIRVSCVGRLCLLSVSEGGSSPAAAAASGGNFASIPCETWQVGAIIGHRGKTIKELERLSGAHIHVDRTTEPAAVKISGSVAAVSKARG